MIKEQFSTELLDELDVAGGGDVVHFDEIVDTLRWANVHEIVFELDGKFWQVNYYVAATEMQESGWGYGDDPEFVEAIQVEPVQVTMTQYRPV